MLHIPEAVPLEQHGTAVLNDANREPGDVPLLHHGSDEWIEARERARAPARRGNRLGRNGAHRKRRQENGQPAHWESKHGRVP